MLAGIGLSLIGFIAALIFIFFNSCFSKQVFRVFNQFFVAFAIGAMLGDVTVHILPHSY